eukprot:scaffold213643_cov31-Tisochrysis_lutea.AAC.2
MGGLDPSHSTSCTTSEEAPCPPLRSTAPQRIDRKISLAASSASPGVRMRRPSSASASGMLGVTSRQRGSNRSRIRRTPSASTSGVPLEETMTGSQTTASHGERSRYSTTSRTTWAEPSMPILMAWARMSSSSARSDSRTLSALGSSTCRTPREFCAVSAVSTAHPCTPSEWNASKSAWMPAPPPESEPAMVQASGRASQSHHRSPSQSQISHRSAIAPRGDIGGKGKGD